MIGGRKFIIPFFNDLHSRKVPGKKYGTVADIPESPATPWNANALADKVRRHETFYIPFFDEPVELIFDGQINELSYYSNRLPSNQFNLIKKIQENANALFNEDTPPR